MNTKFFMIIGIIIIAVIIAVILRRRKLPPLTLRILLWIRSMIRHTFLCVKQWAVRPMYKRMTKEFMAMAAEKQPIKLSDLESTFSEGVTLTPEEEETEKELLVLMN